MPQIDDIVVAMNDSRKMKVVNIFNDIYLNTKLNMNLNNAEYVEVVILHKKTNKLTAETEMFHKNELIIIHREII